VIDSPLKSYEQADDNDIDLDDRVMQSFWRHLAGSFQDGQILIAENAKQLPPEDIRSQINLIRFTGLANGRPGFIPNFIANQTEGVNDDE
jgi:hypothetical protein